MLKLSLLLTVLLVVGIHSQYPDDQRPSNMENTFSSGKFRFGQGSRQDDMITAKPDLPSNAQPLPSPCTGFRAKTKIPHPTEKSKYIQCRDEFHYDVFACPTGAQYNEEIGACQMVVQVKDRCEEEKPCLNDGHCTVVSNSTFKCACKPDWTGDRCETPMNSCVMKPCGPTGECRSLKTTDSEQDYICLCRGRKEYGYNCQEVVPNPCVTGEEQFFPFAFSSRAYIQCDGELIYFQSCGSLLYWNQEEKYCDRRRSHNVDSKVTSVKVVVKPAIEVQRPEGPAEESEELTTLPQTTTTTTVITMVKESFRPSFQRSRVDSEPTISFVPNRGVQRRPGTIETVLPINSNADQRIQETQFNNRPIQSFETSTVLPSGSQWNSQGFARATVPAVQIESFSANGQLIGQARPQSAFSTVATFTELPDSGARFVPIETPKEDVPVRTWQNPTRTDRFRPDQQFWLTTSITPTSTAASVAESNMALTFMRGENFQQQPQQPQWFSQNNGRFPETSTFAQNVDRFSSPFPERFRGEPTFSTTFMPPTTTAAAPMIREPFFDSSAFRGRNLPIRQQQPQQPQFSSQNMGRFPETTTFGQIVDRLPVNNEERFPQGFPERFRGEPTFSTTFMPTTTTPEPMIRENVIGSAVRVGNQATQRPWFNPQNQRVNPTQNFENGLIEPTTLAVNIIRAANFPAGNNNEQQQFMRETTTPMPTSFSARTWPANAFTTPSWQQRQRQPLLSVDSSLFPSSSLPKNDPSLSENIDQSRFSGRTTPSPQPNQPVTPDMNNFETTPIPNGEFNRGFHAWRAVPLENQRRSQESGSGLQQGGWKQRS